ncbi:putative ATPase, AAA-type, core, P-loop containing nucleoside triphosphate hydrolase [Rosa chinensis]|uniref:Putative ATPase, AAA-type, core, P-loop containing nucleoside triphosphate hydrolase n=1 Tax=Rosa chinensis TaxID=74649 RepID=A0A2P6Q1M1_ROSCH|nr:putative ATPase, AAA-type, core, P-loop containing nucleoside triphosphate hydrolase [Rosa chinensis]
MWNRLERAVPESRREADKSDAEEAGPSVVRFSDFGGTDKVIEELNKEVIVPFSNHKLGCYLLGKPMPLPGLLLSGPPGCGKTKLAHAIANETSSSFHKISAPSLVSSFTGGSEDMIRRLFHKAYQTAPSVVFIDEIDVIASKREDLKAAEQRIVAQLLTCMDKVNSKSGRVIVIGATNRPDAIDPALRRPGRFDLEFVLAAPDEKARCHILSLLLKHPRLEGSFDLHKLARATSGFVGADLETLVIKAVKIAENRIVNNKKADRSIYAPEEMKNYSICMTDFEEAVQAIQPSLKREGFNAIPDVKLEDVGGQDSLKQEFLEFIVRPIKYPAFYEGEDLETGVLLYGPPGCGKTLIAKAVANEAGASFIHIKGPELLNKYVGESELQLRTIFSSARMCSPCILFFDEVDSITTKESEGSWVVQRLLKQFLIEFDGGEKRQGVFIIGATNRPDQMDPAILRSGRFGKQILVSLPDKDERGSILKALARKKHIDPSVDLCEIAQGCENFSGADLAMLVRLVLKYSRSFLFFCFKIDYTGDIPFFLFCYSLTYISIHLYVRCYQMSRASKLSKAETFEEFIATGGSSDAPPPSIINNIHFEQARATITPLSIEKIRWYQNFGEEEQKTPRERCVQGFMDFAAPRS